MNLFLICLSLINNQIVLSIIYHIFLLLFWLFSFIFINNHMSDQFEEIEVVKFDKKKPKTTKAVTKRN
jgi:hypothetical protein